jgi:hypothetical protein
MVAEGLAHLQCKSVQFFGSVEGYRGHKPIYGQLDGHGTLRFAWRIQAR